GTAGLAKCRLASGVAGPVFSGASVCRTLFHRRARGGATGGAGNPRLALSLAGGDSRRDAVPHGNAGGNPGFHRLSPVPFSPERNGLEPDSRRQPRPGIAALAADVVRRGPVGGRGLGWGNWAGDRDLALRAEAAQRRRQAWVRPSTGGCGLPVGS